MKLSRPSFLAEALSAKFSRRAARASVPAAALLPSPHATAQDSTRARLTMPGVNMLEFVSIIQQLGLDFTLLGYVTHHDGIVRGLLFEGVDPLFPLAGNGAAAARR